MGFWDDPDLREGGEYFKFDNVGDSITGQIINIKKHVFDDGSVAAQLLLRKQDGTDITVTAGQIRLKIKLNEMRPTSGDWIQITLSNVEKRAGGKTLKDFDVQVRPGQLAPAVQEAAALAQAFPAGQPPAAPQWNQQAAPVQYQQPQAVQYTQPAPVAQPVAGPGPFQQQQAQPAQPEQFAPPF